MCHFISFKYLVLFQIKMYVYLISPILNTVGFFSSLTHISTLLTHSPVPNFLLKSTSSLYFHYLWVLGYSLTMLLYKSHISDTILYFSSLWEISLNMILFRSTHISAQLHEFIFLWLSSILLFICTILFYLVICSWTFGLLSDFICE